MGKKYRGAIVNIYEYMHKLPIEGDKAQVDALTVTATGLQGKIAIGLILEETKDYLSEYKKKPFYFQGASGWQAGSVRYAEKRDEALGKVWSIVMLTGEVTRDCFRVAAKLQEEVKFTRCDIACDIFLYEKALGLARLIKDNYKGRQVTKLVESNTGETVYVGSRQSDAMLRIYDKSKEYGLDLGKVWRWEVEYKGQLAPIVVSEVADGGLTRAREIIFQEARKKSVPSPVIEASRGVKRERVAASSAEMQLAWLARQVAPTVRWLTALGLEDEVRSALQLPLLGEI